MVIIRQPWSTNNQLVGVDREVRGLERLRSFGVVGIELLTWATSEWTEQLAHHVPYDSDIALIMFQYNLAAATPQNSTSRCWASPQQLHWKKSERSQCVTRIFGWQGPAPPSKLSNYYIQCHQILYTRFAQRLYGIWCHKLM